MLADAWAYDGKDECFQFFTLALKAVRPPIAPQGALLEIGCAEANWLALAQQAWPGFALTGIDWRAVNRPGTTIQGDVLTHEFPAESFDLIASISAIEHIGLGHYSQDPKDADGDSKAIARAYRWLKPGGWLFFDVPWNTGKDAYRVCGSSHRIYDDATHRSRLHQGLPWIEHGRVIARPRLSQVDTAPTRLPSDQFYYLGVFWRKPSDGLAVNYAAQ